MRAIFLPKANFILLDVHFGLVVQLGYELLKPGSLRPFLVSSGYWATTK